MILHDYSMAYKYILVDKGTAIFLITQDLADFYMIPEDRHFCSICLTLMLISLLK